MFLASPGNVVQALDGSASPVTGSPISYAAAGKQYVAVPTGVCIFRGLSGVLSPDIYQPPSGNGLYVFALPDQESAP